MPPFSAESFSDLPILLCFNAHRKYYRDVILNRAEMFCGPVVETERERLRKSPEGEFDLGNFANALPQPWRMPGLLVVRIDAGMSSIPRNVASLDCPKLLIVGDTHHQGAAITRIIHYARAERFDLIVGEFNRQHLHFLMEAGLPRVNWLPSFTLSASEYVPTMQYARPLGFFGSSGSFHPYRRAVLEELVRRGLPLVAKIGTRQFAEQCYSETLVNLNITLNGDLNLRVFEVLASGGFLLTDRLTPESGLPLLFEDERDLVQFDDVDHLCRLIQYYIEHPIEAHRIAVAGHETYLRRHRPEIKIQEMIALLNGEEPVAEYALQRDPRTQLPRETFDRLLVRLSIYEAIQEWHRINAALAALFWAGTERLACDAIDLPRLTVAVLKDLGNAETLPAAELSNRVKWLDRERIREVHQRWNVLVCDVSATTDPDLRRIMAEGRCHAMILTDFEAARDSSAIETFTRSYGMTQVSDNPKTYAFSKQ